MEKSPGSQPHVATEEQSALMQRKAEQLRAKVLEKLRVELRYDREGVRWLDSYLQRLHERGTAGQSPAMLDALGAYLGECIVRTAGGRWAVSAAHPCVQLATGMVVFPHSKVRMHLADGAEGGDSVLGFYESIAALQAIANPLSAAQQRFLDFYRTPGHRTYLPISLGGQIQWRLALDIFEGIWVRVDEPSMAPAVLSIPLAQVQSFYVCDRDGGLVHTEWLGRRYFGTLPDDIRRAVEADVPVNPSLSMADLELGRHLVEVRHGESMRQGRDGQLMYATSLTNVSSQRLRITRFGGFLPDGEGRWSLSSVTAKFYTADDFVDWYRQPGEWLLPGHTVCDESNWGRPPVLWAYFGTTEAGEAFVTGEVLELPTQGAFHVKPHAPDPAMAQAIQKLRTNFAQRQGWFSDVTLASVLAAKPAWMRPQDRLCEILDKQKLLYTEGHIVWAALVQANRLLFSPGNADCPALLIYSEDLYFDARPLELHEVARSIFSYKETDPRHAELKRLADLVSNEAERSMKFTLPKVLSTKELYASTFVVFRRHIPNGVLNARVFPVLLHRATSAVMMVPFEFWPIEMIVLWKQGKL
jgi:hypothetical protein